MRLPHLRASASAAGAPLVTLGAAAGAQQTPAAPASATNAQHVDHANTPTLAAARRTGAVTIDGKLNDAAWQAATPFTGFRQLDPQEGQPVSERTEARAM